jgi:hypothetical protein
MPNLRIFLQLFAKLPLSTCSCEHSASAPKRLNSYLCCTQSKDGLAATARIHVNYATPVDVNQVYKLFMPQRIEVPIVCFLRTFLRNFFISVSS